MPQFRVTLPTSAWFSGVVEADTAQEAIDGFEPSYICAQCSGWGQDVSLELADDHDWDNAEAEAVAE